MTIKKNEISYDEALSKKIEEKGAFDPDSFYTDGYCDPEKGDWWLSYYLDFSREDIFEWDWKGENCRESRSDFSWDFRCLEEVKDEDKYFDFEDEDGKKWKIEDDRMSFCYLEDESLYARPNGKVTWTGKEIKEAFEDYLENYYIYDCKRLCVCVHQEEDEWGDIEWVEDED